MTLAVILHLVVILVVMIPSFVLVVVPEHLLIHFSGLVSIVPLIHVPLGTLAILLGVWLVISCRSQGLKGCFKRKKNDAPDNDNLDYFTTFWNNTLCNLLLVASDDLEVYYLWR